MQPQLYKVMVLGGAITWIVFGMFLSSVLRAVDAGEPQNPSTVAFAVLWFLMGVADVWRLLRFGAARAVTPSGSGVA